MANPRQIGFFEGNHPKSAQITIRERHDLLLLADAIPWSELIESAINIRLSQVKAQSGPQPHYRELLGAVALMAVRNITYREAEDLIAHYAPARYLCGLMDSTWQPDHITIFEFTQMLGPAGTDLINRVILLNAQNLGLLDPSRLMSDTTAQEAMIPYPNEVGLMKRFTDLVSKNIKGVGGKFDALKSKAKEIASRVKGLVRRSHLFAKTKEAKQEVGMAEINNVYCNAHARRKFKEAKENFSEEARFFLKQYRFIYRLDELAKGKPPDLALRIRDRMRKYFERMKYKAMADAAGYSTKSSLGKAMSYFLKNYDELTIYLSDVDLPIDNNRQERLLRSPVVGRKTWYGTHSERGARTTAILFSLVESCKLNQVNPRQYFKDLVEDLHLGRPAYTPKKYKDFRN